MSARTLHCVTRTSFPLVTVSRLLQCARAHMLEGVPHGNGLLPAEACLDSAFEKQKVAGGFDWALRPQALTGL
eukprot:6210028-Pleurochrysis_carterae.AAC.1